MKDLQNKYASGINVMETLRRSKGIEFNDIECILRSYDLQAGSYASFFENGIASGCYVNDQKVDMSGKDFVLQTTKKIMEYLTPLKCKNLIEIGCGEATTLGEIAQGLSFHGVKQVWGCDISPSRVAVGNNFLKKHYPQVKATLFAGDMFQLPFADNSFELVFTYHAMEPNTGREREAIKELYRIASKYVVLIEPTFELGNDETKRNIEKHKYVRNIEATVKALGYKIVLFKLFEIGKWSNQSSIMILEKNLEEAVSAQPKFACPLCKTSLNAAEGDGHLFCPDCFLVFPLISGIPLLTANSGHLFSHYNSHQL